MRNAITWSLAALLLHIAATAVHSQSLEAVTRPQEGRSMRATSGNSVDNDDSDKFAKGETKTIALLQGPGKISHIWLTPNSMDIRHPRALVLRIYWDGSDTPSVETPIGDFFAVGNGMQANVDSLPVKVSSYGRGYNCYWQMPFAKQAKITLTNESDKAAASCYYQVDWVKLDEPREPTMYFHARYRQEYPPKLGEPYTALKATGRGHYVGTVLSSQNAIGHWFGEGDDMFFIDGEEVPSLQGTGTEDYINEAWNMRVHSSLYTGCTVFEPRAPDARVTAYRWHLADPIIFQKSLEFQIERRGYIMNSDGEVVSPSASRPDFWSSVSYWYQDTIAEPWCEFPPYHERVNPEVVLHLPQVIDSMRCSDDVELQLRDYNRATYTKPWFRVKNEQVGGWIEIPFNIDEAGRYSMSLFQLLREDNGIWKVFIDGKPVHEAGESQIAGGYRVSLVNQTPPEEINKTLDFYNIFQKDEHEDYIYGQRRERKIGLFHFEPGEHTLRLECVGSNPLSAHPETGKLRYNLTADVLSLRRLPFDNVDAWIEQAAAVEASR
ncbi:glycoside hydrolase family 172 protein [Aeoliella sp.]|uniref:glycoside hydrolase family 172 protein n=1 Tax=Aeoliella sp. TaxID=2795800 RepID=UPI003CCBC575